MLAAMTRFAQIPSLPDGPAAIRVAGHFGEWMQGLLGPGGPVALVTLRCTALGVTARRDPAPEFSIIQPDPPVLSMAQAQLMLARLGLRATGRMTLTVDAPLGGGAGASTAALIALARAAAGAPLPIDALIDACIAAEGASDPLMLDRPDAALWASRLGRIVAETPAPPRAQIIGGFWRGGERTDPADSRFPDISDLIAPWRQACMDGDGAAAAQVATTSAARADALRGAADDPTRALHGALGALGRVRAHTGAARGLIFAPGSAPNGAEDALRAAGLTGVIRFTTGQGGA
jgi:uncharacterized protein involved in propanediol utilization